MNDDIINAALADVENLEERAKLNLDDDELSSIKSLSTKQMELEDLVEELDRVKKTATENLRQIREEKLPEAMMKAEIKSFELSDGAKLSVSKKYIGSISKANEDEALRWFKDTKREGVITPNLTIPVGKGKLERAEEYARFLEQQHIPVSLKPSVHWQTLRAVVRELYENGEEVPSCISTHVINEAKIKRS